MANGTTSPGCDALNQQRSSSSSAPTVTVTATASNSQSSTSRGAIAGLVVLGAVAVLAVSWAIWESRARRMQRNDILKSHNGDRQAKPLAWGPEFNAGFYPGKPEMDAPRRHELDGENNARI